MSDTTGITGMGVELLLGDCRQELLELPEDGIDTCITDPPYELGFMGKEWDRSGVAFDPGTWRAVYRVLKPGAFLLCFGGTRTFHRVTCAIEDAGFEVRDCMMWLHAQGYPKSLDISKAIDKQGGQSLSWFGEWLRAAREKAGMSRLQLARHFPSRTGGTTGCVWNWEHGIRTPSAREFNKLCGLLNLPLQPLEEVEREVIALRQGVTKTYDPGATDVVGRRQPITAPATAAAKLWDGWGTALKPAWEPIIVAMKPRDGTFAENALKWGVAGLNVDGARVGWPGGKAPQVGAPGWGGPKKKLTAAPGAGGETVPRAGPSALGRWPANLALDEDAASLLDEQSGTLESGFMAAGTSREGIGYRGGLGNTVRHDTHGDSGGASRFFYCAKAKSGERGESNYHPTVKPLKLMEYLCTLTKTPTGGVVLDPFLGSGTTAVAAVNTGRSCVGIEMNPEYLAIAKDRVRNLHPSLFAA